MPTVDTRPNVGLNPNTPQKLAGRITEPAVWVPSARSTMPAPTAAADPLDDPPGVWVARSGFVVGPGVNQASSVVTVFPTTTAPAARNNATAAASARGR